MSGSDKWLDALARRQDKAERPTVSVAAGVELGGEAADRPSPWVS